MKTDKVKLYVKPGASKKSVDGLYQDRIKIRLDAPAEKGRANKELIKFLSEILSIPKSSIIIISGKTSNYKEVQINSNQSRDYQSLIADYSKNNL